MRWDNNIDQDELLTEYTEEKIWCPATQRKAVISSPTARRKAAEEKQNKGYHQQNCKKKKKFVWLGNLNTLVQFLILYHDMISNL